MLNVNVEHLVFRRLNMSSTVTGTDKGTKFREVYRGAIVRTVYVPASLIVTS